MINTSDKKININRQNLPISETTTSEENQENKTELSPNRGININNHLNGNVNNVINDMDIDSHQNSIPSSTLTELTDIDVKITNQNGSNGNYLYSNNGEIQMGN
jgi:hypothetical protein